MGKVRVYELAKNMGLESKELLAKLAEAGIEVSTPSSSLADEDVQKLRDFINPPKQKIEEAVIKPGIIRRRRKIVREPVPEPIVTEESVASEASVTEESVAEVTSPAESAAAPVEETEIKISPEADDEVALTSPADEDKQP